MKKKDNRVKLLSRRRLAVKRILTAAAAYLLVTHFTVVGVLFPRHAIYVNEEIMGTGHGRVVTRDWAPDFMWNMLVYLTENENAALLSATYLSPLGWMDGFGVPLDCSKEQPVYGASWTCSRDDKKMTYFVGRVDNPDIAAVEVQMLFDDYDSGADWQFKRFSAYIPREDWIVKDGKSYFLTRSRLLEWPQNAIPYPVLIGYDEDGTEIVRMDLKDGTYSTYN